jgi:hypothetical protein
MENERPMRHATTIAVTLHGDDLGIVGVEQTFTE